MGYPSIFGFGGAVDRRAMESGSGGIGFKVWVWGVLGLKFGFGGVLGLKFGFESLG